RKIADRAAHFRLGRINRDCRKRADKPDVIGTTAGIGAAVSSGGDADDGADNTHHAIMFQRCNHLLWVACTLDAERGFDHKRGVSGRCCGGFRHDVLSYVPTPEWAGEGEYQGLVCWAIQLARSVRAFVANLRMF